VKIDPRSLDYETLVVLAEKQQQDIDELTGKWHRETLRRRDLRERLGLSPELPDGEEP